MLYAPSWLAPFSRYDSVPLRTCNQANFKPKEEYFTVRSRVALRGPSIEEPCQKTRVYGGPVGLAVPAGYLLFEGAGARVMAQERILPGIKRALEEKGSVCEYVRQSDQTTMTAGRDTVYFFKETDGVNWVVRHLTHGGMLGMVTGDRFAHSARPRPFNELLVAEELRQSGIATPPVLAACVFDSMFYYRGEIVREEVPGALDLADVLFGAESDYSELPAMAATGALVGHLHRVGLMHPDLNLRNILINGTEGRLQAHIIDLEKSQLRSRLGARDRNRMLARMRHSASRFENRCKKHLSGEAWKTFDEEYSRAFDASC